MRKYFFQISTIIMVSILSLAYVACGDSGNSNGGGVDNGVIGTWTSTSTSTSQYAKSIITYTFNADGTGTDEETYIDSNGTTHRKSGSFTYVMTSSNQGKIMITESEYVDVTYFEIQNGTMTIYEDKIGGIVELVLTKSSAPNNGGGSGSQTSSYSESMLVGMWEGPVHVKGRNVHRDGRIEIVDEDVPANEIERVELKANHTYSFYALRNGSYVANSPGTWKLDGNKLTVTDAYETKVLTIVSLNRNTFIYTSDVVDYNIDGAYMEFTLRRVQ